MDIHSPEFKERATAEIANAGLQKALVRTRPRFPASPANG